MSILIKVGEEKDLPQVLNLVKELAVFENAPNEVEVTLTEMTNWGFGKEKLFDFFVLEKNNTIVGIALYYTVYNC